MIFFFFIRCEIFRIDLLPFPGVSEELCSAGGKEGQIRQAFVVGKMGEHLLFELRPIASGNHGHFDDAEKVVQAAPTFRRRETICFRQACRPDRKQ